MPTWTYSARIGYGKDGFKPSGGCLHMRSNPRPLTEARRGEGSSFSALEGSETVERTSGSAFRRGILALSQSNILSGNTRQHSPYSTSTVQIEVRLLPRLSECRISNQPCLGLAFARSPFLVSPRLEGWTVDGLVAGAARVASI